MLLAYSYQSYYLASFIVVHVQSPNLLCDAESWQKQKLRCNKPNTNKFTKQLQHQPRASSSQLCMPVMRPLHTVPMLYKTNIPSDDYQWN